MLRHAIRIGKWALLALVSLPAVVAQAEEPILRPLGTPNSVFDRGGTIIERRMVSSPYSGSQPAAVSALPPEAQQLLNQFQTHEAQVRARIEAETQPARMQVIQQLQALQDQYTRAADLDAALAIRDQLRRLQATLPGVLSGPISVYEHRGRAASLLVSVTGAINGSVWGSGPYTDDSDLSTVAVHAGILKVGETATILVRLLPGAASYQASTQNGVTTSPYSTFSGSYTVERVNVPHAYVAPMADRPEQVIDSVYGQFSLGAVVWFRVTGSDQGFVWGVDTYTDDSSVGTAAVHAGILKVGETGKVAVRIVEGQPSYKGSTRNGVTTHDYPEWARSFVFVKNQSAPAAAKHPPVQADPGTLMEYREKTGQSFLFFVTGSINGVVFGDKIYSDDSELATAAVHAGVLGNGLQGVVKVTILPGQQSYPALTRNGITSHSWGQWSASYRVERWGYGKPISLGPAGSIEDTTGERIERAR